ncbi:hypothetical protein [Microbispora sp. KK1-11]|uniref:hypothetical protein n=1 Tax=Microbispora sp. KK1-11 TaxID=2053005 RepID=UPI00115AF854|nr:hypothetical protein [Microbispora sp. KK1-11]TQS24772.1 hypothetical protein FLW16_33700 [Microbispora sp. KK1-11]
MSTWRTAVALSLASIVLAATAACQPREARYLHIENRLPEPVSVRWIHEKDLTTDIGPGEEFDLKVGDPGCFVGVHDDVLVATTRSGRTVTFGPSACMGRTWTIRWPASIR